MTKGTAFRFVGRPSAAQRWDIRFRVAASLVTTTTILAAPTGALVGLTLVVVVLLASARSTLAEVGRAVGGWLAVLGFFGVVGVVWEPTLAQALLLGTQLVRLVLLFLVGHFLLVAATPAAVTEGLRWYLGWLGPRRAWAGANMASWALASVPQVLDRAKVLGDAAVLRGLTPRRHPVRMAKVLTLGLLVDALGRSLTLAWALEARGFGLAVPPVTLRSRPQDWAALAGVIAACALSWVFGGILGA